MAFIKIGDTVINTDHIVAVELDRVSISGKCGVVISVAAKGGLFKRQPREFWFEGEAATRLRDYFSNPNHVTELLQSSSPRSQARERRRLWQRPPFEEPPSSTSIGRRRWGPQSPSPLSAAIRCCLGTIRPFHPLKIVDANLW